MSAKKIEVLLGKLDKYYLRFLYPKIEFDCPGSIVYISGNSEYVCFGTELELIESVGGFPLSQHGGLVAFLRHTAYFQESKIERINRQVDTEIEKLFQAVLTLKQCNRIISEEDTDFDYLLSFLAKPLHYRMCYVIDNGTERLLQSIVSLLVRITDKKWMAGQKAGYQNRLHEMLQYFKKREFKENFQITSDWKNDLLMLQSYFVDRS